MAEDSTTPILNLTAEERRLFGQLFRQADTESIGVVTGEAAVKFFEKTRFEPQVLGKIWQIADKENRGLLTPAGFGIVLRLIGHYQAGRNPTPELALRPGPLPRFENLTGSGLISASKKLIGPLPSALERQISGPAPTHVPPLNPDKKAQYTRLFEKSGAHGGVLLGEQAKKIFEQAGLPNEVLGKIWSLADSEQKGALEVTEFVVAMHLIACLKAGQMVTLPDTLPPRIYEAASSRVINRSVTGATALSSVPRRLSGSSLTRSAYLIPSKILSQSTGSTSGWLISTVDQSRFDSVFLSLDKTNRGFITGDEAVPFFSESKLPEDVLAHIWDLADIDSSGRLSREEFAVAMYLIRQQRAKRDGRESLPTTLPTNLVPPSMRSQSRLGAAATESSFDTPTHTLPRSAADDLFGLDALSSPTTTSELSPQNIEGSVFSTDPREVNNSSKITTSPMQNSSSPQTLGIPFIPSSSFGQSLTLQATGGSKSNSSPKTENLCFQDPSDDPLGDNDPEVSKMLKNEALEVANLSNQVNSLSKQVEDIKVQKVMLQNQSTQSSIQKNELEARMAQLRNVYDQESKELHTLQERLTSSRNEIKKLQIEFETIMTTRHNLLNEQSQIIKAMNCDKEENSKLKESISSLNSEIAQLKSALDKVKLDARQQKGLVAINKKQIITTERERDSIKNQLELSVITREDSECSSSSGLHNPSLATNQMSSTSVNTNPFFRRMESFSENPYCELDSISSESGQPEKLLKNIFGPSTNVSDTKILNQEQERPLSASPSLTKNNTIAGKELAGTNNLKTPSFPYEQIVDQQGPQPGDSTLQAPALQHQIPNLPFLAEQISSNSSPQVSKPSNCSGETNSVAADATTKDNISKSISKFSSSVEETSKIHSKALNYSMPVLETMTEVFHGEPHSNIFDTLSEKNTIDHFPFKVLERRRTVKDDFDSAFANFGNIAKVQELTNTGGSSESGSAGRITISGSLKEFPPIAEIGDDSDSSSEGIGFDDDFASTSNVAKTTRDTPSILTKLNKTNISTSEQALDNQNSPIRASSLTDQISVSRGHSVRSRSSNSSKNFQTLEKDSDLSSSHPENIKNVLYTTHSNSKVLENYSPSSVKTSPGDEFDEFDDLEDAKEGDVNDEFVNMSGNDQSYLKNLKVDLSDQNSLGGPGQTDKTDMRTKSTSSDKHDWDSIFSNLEIAESRPADSIRNEHPRSRTNAYDNHYDDDPFLEKLTGMGYKRAEALAALEKFHYDLEKAANFLASQS